MAEPRTQDNQKIFNSATDNLESFLAGVKNVSSSKNMELIYSNMGKLFETFTQGVLDEQGENSKWLFRTIYRALDDDFLKLLQDSDIVDKISDAIKEKQETVQPENVEDSDVSETTKKVITKTLDPVDYDPNEVTLDFLDELQEAILKVRWNLMREYDKQKIEYAKSYKEQQDGLDELIQELDESNKQDSELNKPKVSDDAGADDGDQKNTKIQQMLSTFVGFEEEYGNGTRVISELKTDIEDIISNKEKERKQTEQPKVKTQAQDDKNNRNNKKEQYSQSKVKQTSQLKPNNVIGKSNIKPITNKNQIERAIRNSWLYKVIKKHIDKTKKNFLLKQGVLNQNELKKNKFKQDKKIGQQKANDKNNQIGSKIDNKKKGDTKLNKKSTELISGKKQIQKKSDSKKGKLKRQVTLTPKENKQKNKSTGSKLIPQKKQKGDKKQKQTKIKPDKKITSSRGKALANKLKGSPPAPRKGKLTAGMPKIPSKTPTVKTGGGGLFGKKDTVGKDKPESEQTNDISKAQTLQTLGKIHGNINLMLKDEKFTSQFRPNFKPIQKRINKTMDKVGSNESAINKDLTKTHKAIKNMKKPKPGQWILQMIMNPFMWMNLAFIVVGSLILISLIRYSLNKWRKTYMPPVDKAAPGVTVFGIPLPNFETIKSFGLGLYNFAISGIPQAFRKIKSIFNTVRHKLFGKKGIFSSQAELWNTIKKIGLAMAIGWAKKAVSWIADLLAMIPGWGTVASIIIKLLPMIFSFIATQIMLGSSNSQADAEAAFKAMENRPKIDRVVSELNNFSRKIPIFSQQTQLLNLQYQNGNYNSYLPEKSAIMRNVSMVTGRRYAHVKEVEKKRDEEKKNKREKLEKAWWSHDGVGDRGAADWIIRLIPYQGEKESWSSYSERFTQSRAILLQQINEEIEKVHAYRIQIKEEANSRFKKVTGPLYDFKTGWNPAYTIPQSQLYTALPFEPFARIHDKRDIKFGEPGLPGGGTDTYIGVMPFDWKYLNSNVNVQADPLMFEYVRSGLVIDAWKTFAHRALYNVDVDLDDPDDAHATDAVIIRLVMSDIAKDIDKYSNISYTKYGDKVNYKDTFVKFLEHYRKGQITENDNNFNNALNVKNRIFKSSLNLKSERKDRLKFERNTQKFVEQEYFFPKTQLDGKKEKKLKKKGVKLLDTLKRYTVSGISYGQVREALAYGGFANIFQGSTITILKPIDPASQLVKGISRFIGSKSINGAEEQVDNHLNELMWNFFSDNRIHGYRWSSLGSLPGFSGDIETQTGFAQSFLEYLGFNVLPTWLALEKLITNAVSTGEYDKETIYEQLRKLILAFKRENILEFLRKHIRFKHMSYVIHDENDPDEVFRNLAFESKRKFGLIPQEKFKEYIEKLSADENDPAKIQKNMETIQEQIGKVKTEVNVTGNGQDRLDILNNTYDRLKERYEQLSNGVKPSEISLTIPKTEISLKPQKTYDELQAERKKREAKEQEERRIQEEERIKKLKEEAARKAEVEAAEKKIAALEAIRKQEQRYEEILDKMVAAPQDVTDEELNEVKDDVENLKKEAEIRIRQIGNRQERELKLALTRGDKISNTTIAEMKLTAVNLSGDLRAYVEEVNQIPVGTLVAVNNTTTAGKTLAPVQDPDAVDMGNQ